MSRKKVLPFSRKLGKISRRGTTTVASIVVGLLSVGLLLVNLGQAGVFTALTSTCIVLLYLAYLLITVPMLVKRINGSWGAMPPQTDEDGKPIFTMGRFGFVVNLLAVLFGIAMMVNLAWPRPEVYGTSPVLQYFALLFLGITVVGGFLVFSAKKRAYRKAIGHEVSRSAFDMGATEAAIG